MRQRRARSDDALFISALAAVLVGIALLLYTTHAFSGAIRAWPLLVIAVGGTLLYFALVRRHSPAFLFGGIAFVLEGSFFLLEVILRVRLKSAWPLAMVVGGCAGLIAGLAAWRRWLASFVAPSLCFIILGACFSLFSFGIVRQRLGRFMVTWWPSFLILGGIVLFAVYGFSRRLDRSERRPPKDRPGGASRGEANPPSDPERKP